MSREEQTQEVLSGYRDVLERQLGRLWAARKSHEDQIAALDVEMGKVHQALANLGQIQVPPSPKPPPTIREPGKEEH